MCLPAVHIQRTGNITNYILVSLGCGSLGTMSLKEERAELSFTRIDSIAYGDLLETVSGDLGSFSTGPRCLSAFLLDRVCDSVRPCFSSETESSLLLMFLPASKESVIADAG